MCFYIISLSLTLTLTGGSQFSDTVLVSFFLMNMNITVFGTEIISTLSFLQHSKSIF